MKSKVLRYAVIALAVAFILIAAGGVTLVFLLFEPCSVATPKPPTYQDAVFHTRLAGRVLKQVFQGKPEQDELVLTQAHVDSSLRLADQAWELGLKPQDAQKLLPPRCWSIRLLPGGRIAASLPYDTGYRLLRGGIVTFRVEFSLQKEPGQPWQVRVFEAKAGKVSLPAERLTARVREALARQEASGKLDLLNAAVAAFCVDEDGQARIVYRPAGFLQLLQK